MSSLAIGGIKPHPKSGIFYYRVKFDSDIATVIGKLEFKRSLKTRDEKEAKKRAAPLVVTALETVKRAKTAILAQSGRGPTVSDNALTVDVELQAYIWRLATLFGPDQHTLAADQLQELREAQTNADSRAMVMTQAAKLGIPVDRREEFLAYAMTGKPPAQSKITQQASSTANTNTDSEDRLGLLEAIEDYIRAERANHKTMGESRAAANDFLSVNKLKDIPVDDIRYEQIDLYRSLLLERPSHPNHVVRGFPLADMVAFLKEQETKTGIPYQRISVSTARRRYGALNTAIASAERRGRILRNPFSKNAPKLTKKEKRIRKIVDFEEQELSEIFSVPRWTGMKSERHDFESGDLIIEDAIYWVFPVQAWTGMRLSEVAQLQLSDIGCEGDIWFINVREHNEEQSVKTDTSVRRIPIHHELIAAGFVKFVHREKQERSNKGWLFRELDHAGTRTKRINKISKFFNIDLLDKHMNLKKVGVRNLDTRSFRNTLKTALRSAGYNQSNEAWYAIMGHENTNVGYSYGLHPLEPLNDVMQSIKVRGASLRHLVEARARCRVKRATL